MRFRISKKLYWLFFSLLFIFLAAGRVFFIGYYFFIPEASLSDAEMAATLMVFYRLATFCTWMGVACIMGVLGILLFPPDTKLEKIKTDEKEKATTTKKFNLTPNTKITMRIILLAIPIVVGILALSLPDALFMDPAFVSEYDLDIDLITVNIGSWSYPAGRFVLNLVLLPLLVFLIPLIFFYLAWKTFGVLRKSYFLNAIGFVIYGAGRISQGLLEAIGATHTSAILSPLLILGSLLIIVIANNYEQLK